MCFPFQLGRRPRCATVIAACFFAATASAENFVDCGNPFESAYGPYDYRTATHEQKRLVEFYHFNAGVESLQSGSAGVLGSDISYTLRAFPNHPRALMSMIRLGQREQNPKPKGAEYPVACWIERAVLFRPDDMAIRQIHGIYASMQRQYDQAIADFAAVLEAQPDNANAHYNLGLAHFEKGNYDVALAEAKSAASLGFPLQGLKEKLKAKGKWRD